MVTPLIPHKGIHCFWKGIKESYMVVRLGCRTEKESELYNFYYIKIQPSCTQKFRMCCIL